MPGPRPGVNPYALASEGPAAIDAQFGVIPFQVNITTDATATSFSVFPSGAPFTCRVLKLEGIMQGAGSAGMTLKLNAANGTAITDIISLALLPNKARFDNATTDTAQWTVNKNDKLSVVTVNSPLTRVMLTLVRTDA